MVLLLSNVDFSQGEEGEKETLMSSKLIPAFFNYYWKLVTNLD